MELKNVSVYYGKYKALNNISISFHNHGQVIGILGENGCGKTTLLNVLLKNINKFKGTRIIDGSIAYMPDKPFLYENMRVYEAIHLFKDVYPDFDSNRMMKILSKFSISPKMKIHDGSKGIHEQIHMALTFSRNVDFYLLDEPLTGVDPFNREVFIKMIKNYRRKDSAVIMVTHLLRDLGDMLDEIMFLREGQLISDNSRAEIIANYGNIENAYIKKVGE